MYFRTKKYILYKKLLMSSHKFTLLIKFTSNQIYVTSILIFTFRKFPALKILDSLAYEYFIDNIFYQKIIPIIFGLMYNIVNDLVWTHVQYCRWLDFDSCSASYMIQFVLTCNTVDDSAWTHVQYCRWFTLDSFTVLWMIRFGLTCIIVEDWVWTRLQYCRWFSLDSFSIF